MFQIFVKSGKIDDEYAENFKICLKKDKDTICFPVKSEVVLFANWTCRGPSGGPEIVYFGLEYTNHDNSDTFWKSGGAH